MVYRILSLDGGGIKGLFTARVLERLESSVPGFLAKTDLFAGTSTGGILALGLAHGISPTDLALLYRDRGPRIFDDSPWDDLVDLGNAVGADYSAKNLQRELEQRFGSTRLNQLKHKVVIPTFDLDAAPKGLRPRMWKPKFFHNFPIQGDGAELAIDVALHTSAAPTYFPTHKGYIDGGVVANNPSMAALAQALDTNQGAGAALDEIVLVSVSTGLEPKFIEGDHNWGWGQWARPMVDLMISGVMGVADYQCAQILRDRYHRVDRAFPRPVNLDDTRDTTLDFLEQEASTMKLDESEVFLKKRWMV